MSWSMFPLGFAITMFVVWAATYARLLRVERENRRLHMILKDRNAGHL